MEPTKSEKGYETNIYYKCGKCNRIIITEYNIMNVLQLNSEFVFTIKDNIKKEQEKASHAIQKSDLNSKYIKCKYCPNQIGYFVKSENNMNLICFLYEDSICSEEVVMLISINDDKRTIPIFSQVEMENLTMLKQAKNLSDMISNYSPEFYKEELLSIAQTLEKIKIKTEEIEDLIDNI